MDITRYFEKINDNFTNQLKNKTILTLKDDIIPYNEIKKSDKIAFIICSKDMKVIERSIRIITNLQHKYKEKDITVVISSSYEKLHKLTNGAL